MKNFEEAMDVLNKQLIDDGYIKDMYSFDYVKCIMPGLVTRVAWDDVKTLAEFIANMDEEDDDNEELY